VLEALAVERHVTRAAHRLGLTQSAASNALRRLRVAFKDELFQRRPGGMEPTALARELAGPVSAALDAVRAAAEINRPFAPASAEATFTLGMSDYAEFVLAPPLIQQLRQQAPGLSVVVRHADRELALGLLDEDRVHLAVGHLSEPPTRMTRIVLLRDAFAVLMRREHPAAAGLDLDAYLAWPHLLVSAVASREGIVDRVLAADGRRRRVAVVASHYLAAAPILAGSDLLATMAQQAALPLATAFGLHLAPLPRRLVLGEQATSLIFHNRYAQHAPHRWLRALLAMTAREVAGVSGRS
jgi:LysR family transcriptional activator of mexEF-oprN operon